MNIKSKFWYMVALLLALIYAIAARSTTISGTVRAADGTGVSGRMSFTLQRPALNTCTTPARQASMSPSFVNVVNGTIQGSVNIVPSSCLSPVQTYLIEMRNGTTLLWTGQYYVGDVPVLSPTTGSKSFTTSGLGSVLLLLSPYKVGTKATGSIGRGGTASVTVTWPSTFSNTSYTVGCDMVDTGLTLTVSSITTKKTNSVTALVASTAGGSGTMICVGRQ